ncbi:efflux RND transporter periplasmic adaptor subunit [Sulfurimonas sp.]
MNKTMKYIIFIALAIVVGVVFYNKVYIPKSTYAKVSPTRGDLNVEIFGIGNVGAKDIYSINAQVAGKILKINSDEGQWVKKGDLLVVMDSVDLPQLLQEAKISVEKSRLEVVATQKELNSQLAQKKLAQVTYIRYKKLKKQSFASQSEYDKAKADLDALEAEMEATKAHINSAKAEVKRSSKVVESLEVKLSRYKVYAPVDGYVISKDAQITQSVLPTQAILKIVDPKTVWVKSYIDERISSNIKIGQKAKITLRSEPNKKFDAYVKRIVAQSDAVTQEREVDVAFDKLPIPFYINEQTEVLITTKKLMNVVKIPSKLLTYKDAKPGVWIIKNGSAHFNEVKVLGIDNGMTAVDKLDADAVLIVLAKDKKPLYEGSRVR